SEDRNTPSWFQFFNKELVRMASFSDHEAFDHPVACLLAVSSKDEHPVSRFIDLFNTNKLPSLLKDGAMDPKILKHYLLVHDNQDGSTDRYECSAILV
ncbi:trafficking protein particle complex subunit 8-like, partial [Trifolium medium]|nr:trafficking protein particle complex subunit 8-like [Trifolium medium]